MPSTLPRAVGILVALVLLWNIAAAQQDHYTVLGVSRNADDREITKAFKSLARKYHPDAQRGEMTAAEKESRRKTYIAIAEAYETLSDKKRREQYDQSGGRRQMASGDDRNFLRHNLFAHDFAGEQIDGGRVERWLDGEGDRSSESLIIFMWSGNVPDSIDPGLEFKRLAHRLSGSSVRPASLQCDDYYQTCRFRLGVPQLPFVLVLPAKSRRVDTFNGKLEFHAMTEFAAKYLRFHAKHVRSVQAVSALIDRCGDPQQLPVLRNPNQWMAPYFSDLAKRSYGGVWEESFVAFEFSSCYDCDTELNLAVEMVAPVFPKLSVLKINCALGINKAMCRSLGVQKEGKAWSIAKVSRRCFYATKKPFRFSDEVCEEPQLELFEGRFTSADMTLFMLGNEPSHMEVVTSLQAVKSSNDSFAVMFVDKVERPHRQFLQAHNAHRHWEILARRVNTMETVVGAKGWKLHVAVVDCHSAHPSLCNEVRGKSKPVVALYPFGQKAKSNPTFYDQVQSPDAMLALIKNDMEPLHLHVMTLSKWSKVRDSLEKGKKWVVLFNAGEWCPPCTHIRPNFKHAARLIQNNAAASKLSVAVVECDVEKNLCNQQGIDNYPTVYFYSKGRDRLAFNGQREGRAISSWAIEAIDNRLQRLGFQEIQMAIQRGGTLVLSFTAGQWCPPCMQLSPIYKQVANRLAHVTVTETNCDEEQWVCQNMGIQGYPTIVMYHKHRRMEFEGQKTVDNIVQWVKGNLK